MNFSCLCITLSVIALKLEVILWQSVINDGYKIVFHFQCKNLAASSGDEAHYNCCNAYTCVRWLNDKTDHLVRYIQKLNKKNHWYFTVYDQHCVH